MADQRFFTRLESGDGYDFVIYNSVIIDGVVKATESGLIHSFKMMNKEKASNVAKSVHERYVELMRVVG